jgi:CheY-like chemotaxis protein
LTVTAPTRTVVVVDDEADLRQLLRVQLQQEEFAVVGEAADGDEALDRCSDLSPDAVVLDLHMPGMSGTDVARHLREADPSLVIVAYTADPQCSNVEELEDLGVSLVAKTGHTAALMDTLRRLLDLRA